MHTLLRGLWNRDPFGGLMLFASYAAINGIVLLISPNAFERNPIYTFLRDIPVPEATWGAAMLTTSAAVVIATQTRRQDVYAILLLLTAGFWSGFGAVLALGSHAAGIISSASVFNIVCAIMCVVAASRPSVSGGQ